MKHKDSKEIKTMLHETKKNMHILQALIATKHERIIEQHTTMETIFTPPSQSLEGYDEAMESTHINDGI